MRASASTARARRLAIRLASSLLGLGLLAAPARAQCFLTEFQSMGAAAEDEFGSAVAVWGKTIAVAAHYAGSGFQGAVFVFEHVGASVTELQQLVPIDPSGSQFGFSLAMHENVIAVGVPWGDEVAANAGAVHVFERIGGTWTAVQKLTVPGSDSGHALGYSVAVWDDRIVAGAPGDDGPTENTGAVHVFDRVGGTWMETAKLEASMPLENDSFGEAVALRDGALAVGVRFNDLPGFNSGCVYIFGEGTGGWEERQILEASDASHGALFGSALDFGTGELVVGAPGDSAVFTEAGAAYVFERMGDLWVERQKLTAAKPFEDGRFGFEVAAAPGVRVVAVAASGSSAGTSAAGAVSVFSRAPAGWIPLGEAFAPDGEAADFYGRGLGISNGTIAVGAPRTDDVALDAGSVYLHTLRTGGTSLIYGAGLAGSGGFVPVLTGEGCPSSGFDFELRVEDGLGGASGALFVGSAPLELPVLGGDLLVLPDLGSLPHTLDGTEGVPGAGTYTLSLTQQTTSLAGLTLYFQAAYVDAGAPQGVSLSAGLRVGFDG